MNKIFDALAKTPLFRDLDKKQLGRLEQLATERSFGSGAEILNEADEGACFFVVTEGTVDVIRGGSRIASLGPGALLGETALGERRGRRGTTVTANGQVNTLAMLRWDFMAEVRENAELAVNMLTQMSARLRAADEELAGCEHEHTVRPVQSDLPRVRSGTQEQTVRSRLRPERGSLAGVSSGQAAPAGA